MEDSCIVDVGVDFVVEESLVAPMPPPRGRRATVDAMAVLAARDDGRFMGDRMAHVGLAAESWKVRSTIARMECREEALRRGGWGGSSSAFMVIGHRLVMMVRLEVAHSSTDRQFGEITSPT